MSNIKKSWFKKLFCCKCKCDETEELLKKVDTGGELPIEDPEEDA